MRKLSQKELVQEGIGTFLKNTVKGSAVLGGRVLKGLAKAASPTATDQLRKFGKAFKDTDKAVIAATTPIDERIVKYFKDMGYKVANNGINPGVSDDTKVVNVNEIVYNDDGTAEEVPVPSPFVIKVNKQGIEIVRGPRQRNPKAKDNSKPEPEPEPEPEPTPSPAQSTQAQPAAQAQPAKPATQPAAQTQPAAPAKPATSPATKPRKLDAWDQEQLAKKQAKREPRKLDAWDQEQLAKKQAKREPRKLDAFDQEQLAKKQAKREELAAQTGDQPAAAAAGARGQTGPRAAKSESPGAAKKRIARAIKSNRPPSKSDIEMLKKAGVKGDQTIGGVKFSALKRHKKLAESRKSQKSLLKHLHSGSQMNKWLVER